MRSHIPLKRWTQAEMDLVALRYGSIPNAELAAILGRGVHSLEAKASSMGLSNQTETHPNKSKKFDKEINVRIRALGQYEQIPHMPNLLNLLRCMSGCMGPTTPQVTKKRIADTRQSQIKRMLSSGMTGREIVHEIGIPKSTVYRHIKEMRATA
jgi:DNA-binding CsgD family transcriptional regulator